MKSKNDYIDSVEEYEERRLNKISWAIKLIMIILITLTFVSNYISDRTREQEEGTHQTNIVRNIEASRVERDNAATKELAMAIKSVLKREHIASAITEHIKDSNVSCYIDRKNPSNTLKKMEGSTDYYTYDDDLRELDGVKFNAAGNMRGITISFSIIETKDGFVLSIPDAIINEYVEGERIHLRDIPELSTAICKILGDGVEIVSDAYCNSVYTVFISMNNAELYFENNELNVYGQWNGTNLVR